MAAFELTIEGGAAYRYVHDVLGSVPLVINVATGQVAQRMDYDSWGVVTSDSSPGLQPFGFAGGLFDLDTRLTRFGARDYDGGTGRWVSPEPLLKNPAWVVSQAASGTHVSAYAYALNNPIAYIDPTGLFPLPSKPGGLPPGWTEDKGHKHPSGSRWRHPSGDYLDFHEAQPGKTGEKGKDHWHHNNGDEHLYTGDEVPEPTQCRQVPDGPPVAHPPSFWDKLAEHIQRLPPVHFGPPVRRPGPFPVPVPVFP
ncbi:MAG: RHS repeat-associated core domain-containing protein [Myxococcales bacterium]|nr:RHS repeat-associated core domain-containing protein [Myxococcales bacterium]